MMASPTYLLLGATSATGRALIERLQDQECRVFTHGFRHLGNLDRHRREGRAELIPIQADLTDMAGVNSLIHQVMSQDPLPQNIVHMAASPLRWGRIQDLPPQAWADDWNVQVGGVSRLFQQLLPALKKRGGGRVVLVLSSVTVGRPPAGFASYVSAKYALLGLMAALVEEYRDTPVSINALSPGMMETDLLTHIPGQVVELARSQSPTGRLVTPTEVAEGILWLLSHDVAPLHGAHITLLPGEVPPWT